MLAYDFLEDIVYDKKKSSKYVVWNWPSVWNFYHSVLNEQNSRPSILTMTTCFSHLPYGKGVEQALETLSVFCTQHGQ